MALVPSRSVAEKDLLESMTYNMRQLDVRSTLQACLLTHAKDLGLQGGSERETARLAARYFAEKWSKELLGRFRPDESSSREKSLQAEIEELRRQRDAANNMLIENRNTPDKKRESTETPDGEKASKSHKSEVVDLDKTPERKSPAPATPLPSPTTTMLNQLCKSMQDMSAQMSTMREDVNHLKSNPSRPELPEIAEPEFDLNDFMPEKKAKRALQNIESTNIPNVTLSRLITNNQQSQLQVYHPLVPSPVFYVLCLMTTSLSYSVNSAATSRQSSGLNS